MFEASHEGVYGGALTRLHRVLFQPFAKSGVKRRVSPLGNPPRLLDEMLVSAEGDVFHTKTVYTIFVQIGATMESDAT